MSFVHTESGKLVHRSTVACLLPVLYCYKKHVATSDFFQGSGVHEALASSGSVQCGFCSPGVAVSMCSAKANHVCDIEEIVDGNLCRCTGYAPFFEAWAECSSAVVDLSQIEKVVPIVTEEFQYIGKDGRTWTRPVKLERLLDLVAGSSNVLLGGNQSFPPSKLVLGNTDMGYHDRYHPPQQKSSRISPMGVRELHEFKMGQEVLEIGAAVTIERFRGLLRSTRVSALKKLSEHLSSFANSAIRSMGTIGGSIVARDELSDLLPPLRALNSMLVFVSKGSQEHMVEIGNFIDERTQPGSEVLMRLIIPVPSKDTFVLFKKVSKRKSDAQCLVSVAFSSACSDVCVSGLKGCALALDASKLEQEVKQRTSDDVLLQIMLGLQKRFRAGIQEHEVASKKRNFIKTFEKVGVEPVPVETDVDSSALPLTKGLVHFVGDDPGPRTTLYASLVLYKKGSKAANVVVDKDQMPGVILLTADDLKEGRNKLGTVRLDEEVLARNVEFHGQPIGVVLGNSRKEAQDLALKVKYNGQDETPINGVYEAIDRVSFSLKSAVFFTRFFFCQGSFFDIPERKLNRGTVKHDSDWDICSSFYVGGQEHFYLEPQVVEVLCTADGMVHVNASCQNPARVQWSVAHVLGIEMNCVSVKVSRIGGGFGGKQDRPAFIAAVCALAARKVPGKAVRLILDRETDMMITGQRHAMLCNYRVKLDKQAKNITELDVVVTLDGGFSFDLSQAVLEVAMFTMDGCYHVNNVSISGKIAKTNRCLGRFCESCFFFLMFFFFFRPTGLRRQFVWRKSSSVVQENLRLVETS